VDTRTGAVRPLVTGVSLYSFDPGCGTGSQAVLTGYLGQGQQVTLLVHVDTATGTVLSGQTLPGELTSAVPAGDAVIAASGSTVVSIRNGRQRTLARADGQVFQVRPNASGSVDFLSLRPGTATTTVWRISAGTAHRVGSGTAGRVALFAGRGGRTAVAGATLLPGQSAPVPVPAAAPLSDVSLDATVVAAIPSGRGGPSVPLRRAAGAGLLASALPTPAPAVTASPPHAAPADQPGPTPACAVPRDDVHLQAPQPDSGQMRWAIASAVTGTLPTRPAGALNLGLPAYSPSQDFPLPSLAGGAPGTAVPREVLDGIFMQESNWSQASWHALPGIPGNPLIADYYGANATGGLIDYTMADCGYGIGQLTDIMKMGPSGQPTALQKKVAVDYAENVAAATQAIEEKWNQLYASGIISGDPRYIENWYQAIWAYNSGVNPQASTGATCAPPGPDCTDGRGNWGLGWANNPANPVYPPDRHPFLHDTDASGNPTITFDDASHPGDWPYQERVLGWAEVAPLDIDTPNPRYRGTLGNPTDGATGFTLSMPGHDAFCDARDTCDPAAAQPCDQGDFHCWWHWPVAPCTDTCHTSTPDDSASTEPAADNPHPPVCTLNASGVPASNGYGPTIVVDDEATGDDSPDMNLVGCPPNPADWRNQGSFQVQYAIDGAGAPTGQIDWHQLGTGFGGHLWFTHGYPDTATASLVTGVWTPDLPRPGTYKIMAFDPDFAPQTIDHVRYDIQRWPDGPLTQVFAQPGTHHGGWLDLGNFELFPGATVSLSNTAIYAEDEGEDIAFDAIAFVPTGRMATAAGYVDTSGQVPAIHVHSGPGVDAPVTGTIPDQTLVGVECVLDVGDPVAGPNGSDTSQWDQIGGDRWISDAYVSYLHIPGRLQPAMSCDHRPDAPYGPGTGDLKLSPISSCDLPVAETDDSNVNNSNALLDSEDQWNLIENQGVCPDNGWYAWTYDSQQGTFDGRAARWGEYVGAWATCTLSTYIPDVHPNGPTNDQNHNSDILDRAAHYQVLTDDRNTVIGDLTIDQQLARGQWVQLGQYRADGTGYLGLILYTSSDRTPGSDAWYVIADTTRFECTSAFAG